MNPNWAAEKAIEAERRGYLRTIDLFAGCGGMSLGFHAEGFRTVGCVEVNDAARASHALNFGRVAPPEGYNAFGDILSTEPDECVAHFRGTESLDTAVDVIIGGPPCQAFSRLGRAALWRLAGKEHAHAEDERASLYHHYLHYVAQLKPLAFVMENVREIGKFAGRNVAEEISATANDLGYETRYCLLNAAWYGVPQLRERMFVIGIRRELGAVPEFPIITHKCEIPTGYSTSRSGRGFQQVLLPADRYVDHAEQADELRPAVTAGEAFADLPPIFDHLDGRLGKGHARDLHARHRYLPKDNAFTVAMKSWPEFESDGGGFDGHVIRYTPRDYETFKRMPAGGMYPEALATAKAIFEERIKDLERVTGRPVIAGSPEWTRLYQSTVPPYKEGRYPNKFRKMWRDAPARTVPAHIGKDSYSHIHFDSFQARAISLREAARLQSFPDAFRLTGSMNVQLTQIGNAVPPLLARAVAATLRQQIADAVDKIREAAAFKIAI